jgi:CotH protein/lamin tail-like protein
MKSFSLYRLWRFTRIFIFIILAIFFILSISAYDPNDYDNYVEALEIFDDSTLPDIHVTLDPDDLYEILRPGNEWSDTYYPAFLTFKNHLIDDSITTVGLRLRGNTSRNSAKKSFKISFNEYIEGRRFHGLRKLNLNGEHNDPSIFRSKLSWNLFNSFGVPAPRSSHVKLYINNEYRGLYINVEHIDSTFIRGRFGEDSGNLFKCLYQGAPAELTYRSDELYGQVGGGDTYQLKINEENPDFSDLAHFIDVLNNAPDENFPEAIRKVFNVSGFLKWMVVSTSCGSWDDYMWLANNYYLYHNRSTDKFEFIPYDYDNTFGIDWFGKDWAKRDVYDFYNHGEFRPLAKRIMSQDVFINEFSFYLDEFYTNHYSLSILESEIDRIHTLISDAAKDDVFRTYDYGYSFNDFNRSFSESTGAHVKYGIKPFISTRRQYSLDQLKPYTVPTPSPTPTPTPTPTSTPTPDCDTSPTLVINEICADNDSLIADETGDFGDWIEIYNHGDKAIWMGGMYLTDDSAEPLKHRIGNSIIIDPGEFLLLWADSDEELGDTHLSFKLSKIGESVGLYERDECGNREIDLIDFSAQDLDKSFGRQTDADPVWITFDSPTPGYSNTGSTPTPTPTVTPVERVSIEPDPPYRGQDITINYNSNGGPLDGRNPLSILQSINNWDVLFISSIGMEDLSEGLFRVKYKISEEAKQIDFVFRDNNNHWDNNNRNDWHFVTIISPTPTETATATPTETPTPSPTPTETPGLPFLIDGDLDDDIPAIVKNADIHLYAKIDQGWLYLATERTTETLDQFILIAKSPGPFEGAPWSKSGNIASWNAYMAREVDNGWTGWSGAGSTEKFSIGNKGKYFEGVIKLDELFSTFPDEIYISAVRYETWTNGNLAHDSQLPPSINGDGNVDKEEYQLFSLLPSSDAQYFFFY